MKNTQNSFHTKNKLIVGAMLVTIITFGIIGYRDKGTLRVGSPTPHLSINTSDISVNLQDYRGKYVLVDFWSSADAPSRIMANEYTRQLSDSNLSRVSVNFDRSEALFHAIIDRDGLDPESQYFVEGVDAQKIRKDFNLSDGYKSFLIGPDGRIVAVNPDSELLNLVVDYR